MQDDGPSSSAYIGFGHLQDDEASTPRPDYDAVPKEEIGLRMWNLLEEKIGGDNRDDVDSERNEYEGGRAGAAEEKEYAAIWD